MLRDRKGLFSGFTDLKWYGVLFIIMLLGAAFIFMSVSSIENSAIGEDLYWEAGYLALALSQHPIQVPTPTGYTVLSLEEYLLEDTVDKDLLADVLDTAIAGFQAPEYSPHTPSSRRPTFDMTANFFVIHQGELVGCARKQGGRERKNAIAISEMCKTNALRWIVSLGSETTSLEGRIRQQGALTALEEIRDLGENPRTMPRGVSAHAIVWIPLPNNTFIGVGTV